MAKTTREKPPKKQKTAGPILVDEPNNPLTAPAEAATEEDFDTEEEEAAETAPAVEPTPHDPRCIPPAWRMEPPQFAAFVAQYPDPSVLDAYFYRLTPIVKAIPPPDWPPNKKFPTYCEKLKGLITPQTNQVFTWEWLTNVRGSGKYNIKLVDRSLKRTQHREICQTIVEINEWDSRPPVLNDWQELVPCDANKWIIDRLLREKVIKRTPEGGFVAYEESRNGTAPAITDPAAMLKQTVDLAKDLAQTMTPKEKPDPKPLFSGDNIVAMLKETQAANDPQKIISAAKELVQIAKPAEVKQDNSIVTLLTGILDNQGKAIEAERARAFEAEKAARTREEAAREAARQREHELTMKLMEKNNAPPAPAVDPIQQMKSTAEAYKSVKDVFDDGTVQAHNTKMNGWQEFVQPVLVGLLDTLKPLVQVGAALLAQKASGAPPQPQPMQPRPQPPVQNQAIPQGPQMPPQGQQQQPQMPQQPQQGQQPMPQPQPPQMSPEEAELMQQIAMKLRLLETAVAKVDADLRAYFERGSTGAEFAELFCDLTFDVPPPLSAFQKQIDGAGVLHYAKEMCADPQFLQYCRGNPIIQLYQQPGNAPIWTAMCPTPAKAKEFEEFIADFLAYDPEAEDVIQPEVIP